MVILICNNNIHSTTGSIAVPVWKVRNWSFFAGTMNHAFTVTRVLHLTSFHRWCVGPFLHATTHKCFKPISVLKSVCGCLFLLIIQWGRSIVERNLILKKFFFIMYWPSDWLFTVLIYYNSMIFLTNFFLQWCYLLSFCALNLSQWQYCCFLKDLTII